MDNSVMIAWMEEGAVRGKRWYRGINGDGKRLDWGGKCDTESSDQITGEG